MIHTGTRTIFHNGITIVITNYEVTWIIQTSNYVTRSYSILKNNKLLKMVCVCIYIHIHVYMYIYIYIYLRNIYMNWELYCMNLA